MVIVSKNDVPAKTLKEFIAWAKRNSGKISAGTAGAGSGSHIGGVYFENVTGVKLQFVPYRGTGPALNDLMGGQIDIMIDQTSNSINQIRSGKIRAYAVTDQKRVPTAGDIPTVDEAGLPGFHMTLWSGMWVPKGTPKTVIAKLNTAVIEANGLHNLVSRCRRAHVRRRRRSPHITRPKSTSGGRLSRLEIFGPISCVALRFRG
jgi:tripartite-type tricarboxylate transporter receptor subunit TctC